MNPYYNDFSATGASGSLGPVIVVLIFSLALMVVTFVLCAADYVLSGLSLYTIAKRRGIPKPWLAWIPVGDAWILGSISDQYQLLAKSEKRNKRKVLLGLNFLMLGLLLLHIAAAFLIVPGVLLAVFFPNGAMVLMLLFLVVDLLVSLLSLVLIPVYAVLMVFQYIAFFDLFESCDPEHAVLYLILGIATGFAMPVCMFLCRNKDLGMPPQGIVDGDVPAEA